jgi:hypothetical protein
LGISYPTIRSRLHEIIRLLGYEPGGGEELVTVTPAQRQNILAALEKGEISAEDALKLLQEGGGI